MAIPNSPNWSSLTDVKPYPEPSFVKPPIPQGVAAVSLGPIALNDSQGVLNSRYWLVRQEVGGVYIYKGDGNFWIEKTLLFQEQTPISKMSLTFDQLGRPLVFYRTNDVVKINWFDPIAQQNEIRTISNGDWPTACFDFPQDTGQSFTDILLFYVRNNKVYMRVQRDRFDVEYDTGVERDNIEIESAGLTVENRLQVIYRWPDFTRPPTIDVVLPPTG